MMKFLNLNGKKTENKIVFANPAANYGTVRIVVQNQTGKLQQQDIACDGLVDLLEHCGSEEEFEIAQANNEAATNRLMMAIRQKNPSLVEEDGIYWDPSVVTNAESSRPANISMAV